MCTLVRMTLLLFFSDYPLYQELQPLNRLNTRYQALIENNKEIIKNSSILDLASHDGRWSFAALKSGAKKIVGIEGRKELVKKSNKNMEYYGIPKEKYEFYHGDIFEEIKKFEPKTFDVVFCFGVFYHIMNHTSLISEIKQLKPKHLILDTSIDLSERAIIYVKEEDSTIPINAIKKYSHQEKELCGLPSKSFINLLLKNLGFSFTYYNWHDGKIKNWYGIKDYETKRRISLLATLNNST